ncbi:MAG: 3',5'-cyclic-nucleotide phosphodiesterase [Bacteriovoracaceae bacterium]|nr:3',5'-cyclic-nucleotide phosphodiesterase [Bacteriovoracaceae bacterium]
MKVKVIGSHGGVAPGFKTTSFLIDDCLLIDAGSVAEGLTVDAQKRIDHILISHAHLDHIKDMAFLCDNCFGLRDKPFEVYSHHTVKNAIKAHLMNDIIWPDFSKIPNETNPTIRFNEIIPEKKVMIGGYEILPVSVNHPGDTLGYIVQKDNVALLFTLDTSSTDRIWQLAKKYKNLAAIFTEISFPDHMQAVAELSYHHCPKTLAKEIRKMPMDIPIYIGHLKPQFHSELITAINGLEEENLHILDQDGMILKFT